MNRQFETPAQIQKIETLMDGSVKVVVETPILSEEAMAILFGFARKLGVMAFAEHEIQPLTVPTETLEFKNDKSYAQRQRNVLWKIWEAKGKQGNFDDYYRTRMENNLTKLKNELDELTH